MSYTTINRSGFLITEVDQCLQQSNLLSQYLILKQRLAKRQNKRIMEIRQGVKSQVYKKYLPQILESYQVQEEVRHPYHPQKKKFNFKQFLKEEKENDQDDENEPRQRIKKIKLEEKKKEKEVFEEKMRYLPIFDVDKKAPKFSRTIPSYSSNIKQQHKFTSTSKKNIQKFKDQNNFDNFRNDGSFTIITKNNIKLRDIHQYQSSDDSFGLLNDPVLLSFLKQQDQYRSVTAHEQNFLLEDSPEMQDEQKVIQSSQNIINKQNSNTFVSYIRQLVQWLSWKSQ